MKTNILSLFALVISTSLLGQSQKNIFKTYQDFQENQPVEFVELQLKQRTMGNVVMTGGITNFRVKKVVPKTRSEEITKKIWGVIVDDSIYINSYPYSQVIGYNKVIEKGYYSYFIGQPAFKKEKQVELGIIKPDEPRKDVCCKTSYVILPDGKVKWLTPSLLSELIADNQKLVLELKSQNLKQEDAFKMFEFLKKYNEMK